MRKALCGVKLGQFHIYIVARLGGETVRMREMPVYLSSLLCGWNCGMLYTLMVSLILLYE